MVSPILTHWKYFHHLGDYNRVFCRHWVRLRGYKGALQVNFALFLILWFWLHKWNVWDFDQVPYLYSTYKGTRTRAAIVFVIGFWMLDLANNTVQVSLLKWLSPVFYIFLVFISCTWCVYVIPEHMMFNWVLGYHIF